MNKAITIGILLSLTACGYSSTGNEGVCQPKKMHHNTPIVCSDYDTIDVSMGVMRNGVGSMSTQDMTLAFSPATQADSETKLKQAIDGGKLVKMTYSDRRFSFCQETEQIETVEIIETTAETNEDKEQHKKDLQQLDKLNKE